MNINRVKPGQGLPVLDGLNNMAAAYNGDGYEFWVEWQPHPDLNYELRAGYYLHVLYEYTKIDHSLTEFSERWRNFKYGIWLGGQIDAATHNLADAIEITRRSFERRSAETHILPSRHSSELVEL
ncbi:MAG: hypothetical protein R2911_42605 [Caldilineaceae bacterium]